MSKFFWILLFTLAGCSSSDSPKKQIIVYTHSSFLASYGPGVELSKAFEKETGIHVKMIDAGDASLVLQRLKLDEDAAVDVIVGLDQISMVLAKQLVKWKDISVDGVDWNPQLPKMDWGRFVPYDWSPLTFVYKKDRVNEVDSWDDLLDQRFEKKLAIEDPRLSTPGQQFLSGIMHIKGQDGYLDYLRKFKNSVYRVTPSWSSGYSLFQKGKVSAVFSYLTSPVYHWMNDKDYSYQPVVFKEGHPVQVELAAVPDRCKNCEGAIRFVKFLLCFRSIITSY